MLLLAKQQRWSTVNRSCWCQTNTAWCAAAVQYLADKGFDPVYGARPVKRAVQRDLETVIAKAILRGEFGDGDTVIVDADDRGLLLRRGASVPRDSSDELAGAM